MEDMTENRTLIPKDGGHDREQPKDGGHDREQSKDGGHDRKQQKEKVPRSLHTPPTYPAVALAHS